MSIIISFCKYNKKYNKNMRSLVDNRAKNITLKQYISTNNLRKRLSSRSKSRQIQNSSIQYKKSNLQQIPIFTSMTKPELINEIKIKLTEFIVEDTKLAQIIRMIDRLVQLFHYKKQESLKESVILSTMIKQNTEVKKSKNNFTQNPLFNFSPIKEHNIKTPNTQKEQGRQRKKSITLFHHIRSISNQSQEIPDINLVLSTRKGTSTKSIDLQTQQTLPKNYEQTNIRPRNNSNVNIFTPEDISSMGDTNRSIKKTPQKLTQIPELKQDDSLAQISIHSSLWKQAGQSSVLNKFEDFKKRRER